MPMWPHTRYLPKLTSHASHTPEVLLSHSFSFFSMEDSSSLTDIDDWFIETLHMYRELHSFELQDPTRVIEWTSEKSICVAGYKTTKTNDILELLLPGKLIAKDNQGLCPARDFEVDHGGLSAEPITCLKPIAGTRCVVTSGSPESSLQIWQIGGDDTDVIKKTGFIQNRSKKMCKLASGAAETPSVLHGSQIRDVELTELASGKLLYKVEADRAQVVSSLQFIDANAFLICADNGDLCFGDIRDCSALQCTSVQEQCGSCWCMDLKKGPSDAASCQVARLSSASRIVISDLRDLKSPLCQAQLNIPHEGDSHDFLNVSWAPTLDNSLAVSGFDGMVRIYDTTAWQPELMDSQPLFVHKGHMMSSEPEGLSSSPLLVTTHRWHPKRPRTVLSAATDGSLHVWDWVERTASC